MDIIEVSGDVASIFRCPVCDDYMKPPILQCHKGHLICSNCSHKLTHCPICGVLLKNIRNFQMEKAVCCFELPCKYSTSGCTISLPHTKRRKHEESCEFRPSSCPYLKAFCKWQGSFEQVVPHLMESHERITRLEDEDGEITLPDLNEPDKGDRVYVISRFGHDFLVTVTVDPCIRYRDISVSVELIGSRKQAAKFQYKLEVNDNERRVTCKGITRSIKGCNPSKRKKFSCKGKLSVNVSISMV